MQDQRPRKIICIALLVLMGCAGNVHQPAGHGDETLYALPGLDHGLIQSPVNILTSQTESGKHQIVFGNQSSRAENVANTGHTIQLNFEPGATTTFDGKNYEFIQCHFHTPSEHLVDGVTYPMEMHCVSMLPAGDDPDAPPEYLVGAFLFKMGAGNRFIDEFLSQVPETEATADLAEGTPVYLKDLLEPLGAETHYYIYSGSLTTPPYTETVTWLILDHIIEASPEQIRTINRIEGNNARHVQALYDRQVESQ